MCIDCLKTQKNGGKPPLSYQSFLKLAGQPSWASSPLPAPLSSLPPVGDFGNCEISEVPTVKELGYEDSGQVSFEEVLISYLLLKKALVKIFSICRMN